MREMLIGKLVDGDAWTIRAFSNAWRRTRVMANDGGYIYCPRSWPVSPDEFGYDIYPKPSRNITEMMHKEGLPSSNVSICLISCDGSHLHYLSIVTRSERKVSSSQWRLTFSDFVGLEPLDIDVRQLQPYLSPMTYGNVWSALNDRASIAVSREMWDETVRAMLELHPDLGESIGRLENLLSELRRRHPAAPGYEVMAQELDAINTALWINGFDRTKEIRSRMTPPQSPTPVVTLLGGVEMREDAMADFDKGIMSPLWREVSRNQIGMVAFEDNDGRRLTVMNVNRTPIEQVLGVDVIYVNHSYRSFAMVQYKRMLEEKRGDWGFRPDPQFHEEATRMHSTMSTWSMLPGISEPLQYRLHGSPFYFKFVPSVIWETFTTTPLSGMYMPLDYWTVLENSPSIKGPRGGVRITFDNVERHLTTTQFVSLMQSGWIGSHAELFEQISNLIIAKVRSGDSVLIAIGNDKVA